MIRAARALLLATVCAASGCGVGGVLAGSAGGGGGGGGGAPVPPPPPSIAVSLPGGEAGENLVSFKVRLTDPRIDPAVRSARARIDPLYSVEGGASRRMTDALTPESDGTRDLELGVEHTFVWNTVVDLGGYSSTDPVDFRFEAQYEDAEEFRRRFVAFAGEIRIDNRLAGTLVGGPSDLDPEVDTFPIDLRPDGSGFLVACLGANIVERVDSAGRIDRVVGLGVPGAITGESQAPGVARLPRVFGVDTDALGNVYTTHDSSVVLTNRGPGALVFGLLDEMGATQPDTTLVPPRTAAIVIGRVFTAPLVSKQLGPSLTSARAMRRHPGGALLFLNGGGRLLAANPQDPSDGGSAPIVLGGVVVSPGEVAPLAGGGNSTSDGATGAEALLADAIALAVGPDGEIYVCERTPGRVRVFNAGAAPITVGGAVVLPGTVHTVAGGGGTGAGGDGGPAAGSQLDLPSGIDVASPQRVLFIADTRNLRVRAANLSGAAVTFAATGVAAGAIDTVIGGGTTGGEGSKARDLQFTDQTPPNSVAVDANGNALVAAGKVVYFVNGSDATVRSYGATAGAARVALVYDATDRGGLLLVEPRAMAAAAPDVVYFADRSSVRVMNLGSAPAVFGGAAADPGASAIVGGGAVPGYSGDGGPARVAAFSEPSALAAEGPFILYVADTENDAVRVLNNDDPRLGPAAAHTALGVSVAAGGVETLVGGQPRNAVPPADLGDGGAPRQAFLSVPQGLAVSNAGLLFVSDTGHHRIRVVNPGPGDATVAGVVVAEGTIRTVVGDGIAAFTPDGAGPWRLDTPTALAVDRDLLYFADAGNARIRVLNLSADPVTIASLVVAPGEIRTICGNGTHGNAGDFGLGVEATIDAPRGFALQTLNSERAALYFADGPQHVVRMLNLTSDTDLVGRLDENGSTAVTVPDGSIVSLAGGPNIPGFRNAPGFDGDGREPTDMRLAEPWGIAVTTFEGVPASFFVADSRNHRVRRFGAPPLVR